MPVFYRDSTQVCGDEGVPMREVRSVCLASDLPHAACSDATPTNLQGRVNL